MGDAIDIALTLNKEMPDIGFFNKAKRLDVFFIFSIRLEELANLDTEIAMLSFSILIYI